MLFEVQESPDIVEVEETSSLQSRIKECQEGKSMIVHLGDCSETFKDCNETSIKNRYVLFTLCQLMMSKILKKEVVKIGRIAGQYAKPRSNPMEIVNGEKINSFFGDNVNNFEATKEARVNDPEKLIKGYYKAFTTYHTLKKLSNKSFNLMAKDIVEAQFREQVNFNKEATDYEDFINSVKDCLEEDENIDELFVSHEALLLDYESR
jgi:3-deoxy-7-phosphoheptulonate synthase